MSVNNPFFMHAIQVDTERCNGCSHCMNACPTEAIRVWRGKAVIDDDKCIDCGECYRVCPEKAIYVKENTIEEIFNYKYRVALFPSVLVGQFSDTISRKQIFNELYNIGFTHIFEVEKSVRILKDRINDYITQMDNNNPVISSFCPSVIRLIQIKYPSLTENIMKLQTPVEISALYFRKMLTDTGVSQDEIGVFYISPCAAKSLNIFNQNDDSGKLIDGVFNLNTIYSLIFRKISNKKTDELQYEVSCPNDYEMLWSITNGEAININTDSISVDGISHVAGFMELIEDDEIERVNYIECRACKEGCAGGVLNVQNRFLTVERLKERAKESRKLKNDTDIDKYRDFLSNNMDALPVESHSMMMLDSDMSMALKKMSEAREIEEQLPGIDCGACGAPTCKALSEDIAKGNATLSHCIFVQQVLIDKGEIDMKTAFAITDKIWGHSKIKGRFKELFKKYK